MSHLLKKRGGEKRGVDCQDVTTSELTVKEVSLFRLIFQLLLRRFQLLLCNNETIAFGNFKAMCGKVVDNDNTSQRTLPLHVLFTANKYQLMFRLLRININSCTVYHAWIAITYHLLRINTKETPTTFSPHVEVTSRGESKRESDLLKWSRVNVERQLRGEVYTYENRDWQCIENKWPEMPFSVKTRSGLKLIISLVMRRMYSSSICRTLSKSMSLLNSISVCKHPNHPRGKAYLEDHTSSKAL